MVQRQPIVELQAVSKLFNGHRALDSVDLSIYPGEVHVLFGENGAGKSTIINIIAGTFRPTGGIYNWQERPVFDLDPHGARDLGIRPVFQEFSLVDELTVWENIFLGREERGRILLKHASMRSKVERFIAELGFDIDVNAKLGSLDRSHQQMVEIAKALYGEVKLLILDEPTASLTDSESERLFDLIGKLRSRDVAIIYVSHRMGEIRRLADRITVLRDGRTIATVEPTSVDDDALIQMMTGRPVGMLYPKIASAPGPTTVVVRDLCVVDGRVRGASFVARSGEVTGIAGLVGCGKSELIRAIFGLERVESGEISIGGATLAAISPALALSSGVCYFPSDRATEGLSLDRSVKENASIAAIACKPFSRSGLIDLGAERKAVKAAVDRLEMRPPALNAQVRRMSGGNRQKVVLARGMMQDFEIYLFDEPTVGIDVGAKAQIYGYIKELVEAGKTIVVVSSDLSEVIALSDRLYVMYRGAISAELTGTAITEENALMHFFKDGSEPPARREAVH